MNRGIATLAALSLLSFALGSLHAFSVLLEPLERGLGIARAEASLFYSLALVSLTLGILAGPRLYGRIAPPRLALLLGAAAAAGLALAALAREPALVGLGYGVLFGFANGVGYGLCLQRASLDLPRRKGLAVGVVTAAYAGGAAAFAKALALLAAGGGAPRAFWAHAAFLLAAGGLAALGLARGPGSVVEESAAPPPSSARIVHLLWFGYFFGATTGLMVIGHAAGIVAANGGGASEAALGAVLIATGNAAGALAAGWLADRAGARLLLAGAAALAAADAGGLAFAGTAGPTIAGLAVAGFAYGALIALYPVAVAGYFGAPRAPRIFARVFVAWGVAGLIGPWLAGVAFDASGGYDAALLCAAAAAALSALLSLRLPPVREARSQCML